MGLMLLASCVAQPAMPVRVEYDLTPRTEGIKVRLHNHGHRSLWVTVEFINHERGLSRTVKLFLPAGAGHEVGWYDGWKFEPGECVRIKHGDFQDKHVCLE
ncbi:hypothetical protein [Acanthopleuribacter pedis]|uniref:Uncharacterized protein n=1 Tax=Acanthopleuribacter pedis TaxID=442870 RepID=A0A8J7Q5N8_9BACT|nr:hypothetical protein [Acanthopleuribacter pedis]MBO1320902.1 hypothetical protein [Acanthopleuribacter pedis]